MCLNRHQRQLADQRAFKQRANTSLGGYILGVWNTKYLHHLKAPPTAGQEVSFIYLGSPDVNELII